MKHMIIPLIALVLVVGFGIYESLSVYNTYKEFEKEIDNLMPLCYDEDLTDEIFADFCDYWTDVREKSEFFLHHNDVYEITLRIGEIKAYVKQKDYDLCVAHLSVIKDLAAYIGHLAIPSFEHVM